MTTNDPETYGDYSVDDETQLDPGDTLEDDDVTDELERGFSPPERYSAAQRYGNTPWEAEHAQPLDDRLAQEDPEPDPYADEDEDVDEQLSDYDPEVGDARAGRLVDPDYGSGEDRESELFGEDVGIDGAAASAEEAAVHVIDD
ncbi:hypothetical protein E8D34_06150 [Nocardioides sp. GY 10113]|uniref:DUF5709 domain-containing protein n=1 Tax=Nocardioides sp. GY 10113 TaxID=2569761 RepID=UPI0010A8A2B7|nr:DUF5709 domain-containing protein [Nocardioides sp. GY 10113]TIC88487.1 hypothetical protein E8D34_06150 [Nocardioides sp. GY 10113]